MALPPGGDPRGIDIDGAYKPVRDNLEALHAQSKEGASPIHADDPSTGFIPMYPIRDPGKAATMPGEPGHASDLLIGQTTVDEYGRMNYGNEQWARTLDRLLDRNQGKGEGGGLSLNIHPKGIEHGLTRPIHVITSPSNGIPMGDNLGAFAVPMGLGFWNSNQWKSVTPHHEMFHALLDQRARPAFDGRDTWEYAFHGFDPIMHGNQFWNPGAMYKRAMKWGRKNDAVLEFDLGPGIGKQYEIEDGSPMSRTMTDVYRYMYGPTALSEFRNDLASLKYDAKQRFGMDPETMDGDAVLLDKIFKKGPRPFHLDDPTFREGPKAGEQIPGYNERQRALDFFIQPLLSDPDNEKKLLEMWHDFGQAKQPGPTYG
jgi:hypothetical protein